MLVGGKHRFTNLEGVFLVCPTQSLQYLSKLLNNLVGYGSLIMTKISCISISISMKNQVVISSGYGCLHGMRLAVALYQRNDTYIVYQVTLKFSLLWF